jgi:hypothetical protein
MKEQLACPEVQPAGYEEGEPDKALFEHLND